MFLLCPTLRVGPTYSLLDLKVGPTYHMSTTRLMLLAAVAACSLAAPLAAQKADATRPMLDGAWTLNRELSSPAQSGAPDPGDGWRPSGQRRRPGGFGGDSARPGSQDREELARRRDLMREVLEAPRRFLITVEDPLVIFTFPDGRVVRYSADGGEERHQHPSGTVKTKTRWQADGLAIETDLGGGLKVTHTYRTTSEPRQLIVTTLLPRRAKDLPPIQHTYDEAVQ